MQPVSNSNGSVAGFLKHIPVKALIGGMAAIILMTAGVIGNGYANRLTEVEKRQAVLAEDVNTLKSKIDTIANDVSWLRKYVEKYLENRR